MAAAPGPLSSSVLLADYNGISESKSFSHSIEPLPAKHSVQEKTKYLSSLRSSVVKMQDEINAYLTAKMEEDSKAAGSQAAIDDKKEEENYGEEVVDEE